MMEEECGGSVVFRLSTSHLGLANAVLSPIDIFNFHISHRAYPTHQIATFLATQFQLNAQCNAIEFPK